MDRRGRARIALVVPDFCGAGGVPAVARFLWAVAEGDDRYAVDVVSLSTSADDPLGVCVRSPSSWRLGVRVSEEKWNGRPLFHVGVSLAEFEFRRYRPRRVLSEIVARYDLVQVVCGSAAWAAPVIGLGRPVSLQVATRVRVERRRRDALSLHPLALWRRAMTNLTHRIEEHVLSSVDAIQVENTSMMNSVRQLNAGRLGVDIRLAPPGIDAHKFRPVSERCLVGAPYVLAVGRLSDPRKNVGLLIDSFRHVVAQHPTVRLVTAGSSAPPPSFWSSVAEAGLTDRVRHVAGPSTRELVSLYQQASVFVLTSNEEGLGIVLLEAMACGIPVVATRCGGPDGVIADGSNGYLVGLDDARAMADRVLRLLSDPHHNRQMGLEARRTVECSYSREVTSRTFTEIWDGLLMEPTL